MEPEDECLQMHLLTEYRLSPTKSSLVNAQLLGYMRSKSTKNFKSLIEQLPKSGIDVNRVFPNNGSQETCLDIACKEGLHEFVQILLQNGANVNRINKEENRAAIHYATEKGHEHVLQVLLENPQINPNLRAGAQTALHIAVTTKNLRCAELLLEKGANPYVPNNKGLTALHVAAMKKQRPMAELILEKSTRPPDLDSYRDYNGKTTRDVLERNMPELLLPKHTDRPLDVNDLIYHLQGNDETNFLDCLRKMPKDEPIEIEDLIVLAAEHNIKNAVSKLLEKLTSRCNLEEAAVKAIQNGSPHILRLIMGNFDADPGAANNLLLEACMELGIPGGTFKESVSNRLECLRLILNMKNVDVNCADRKGNTPLHYAARADSREAVMMLLEKGSYIGQRNKYGMPAVADIPASTLSQYFDDCIQARKGERKGYQIELDYKCLIPQNNRNNNQQNREMDVFQSIAGNSGLKELLKHPLLSSFIDLKWQRISLVLNASFFFHLLLYVILCVYVVSKINIDNSNPTDQPAPERTSNIMFSALAGMFLVFALWQLFQLILSPCCYLANITNWCEMGLAILGFSMLFGDVHNSIAAVVILSFSWLLVIKMGHYSTLSMDIEMFITVFMKFLRFLFVYITLIFSFAVGFFVLFNNQENFLDLGQSMFKTIIMLTGDMGSISFDEHPVTNRLAFVLFVSVITMVLFNLLNGLAVNDTAKIVGKAELVGLIYKIRMISDVESLALNTPYNHSPNCWLFNTSLRFWRARPIPYLADKVLLPPECLKENKHTIDLSIPKMDSGIAKPAREILSRRDQKSDTKRIISELEILKDMLRSLKRGLHSPMNTERSYVRPWKLQPFLTIGKRPDREYMRVLESGWLGSGLDSSGHSGSDQCRQKVTEPSLEVTRGEYKVPPL
ncbi:transient receptor potential cation channel protein painless-like [Lasioglossum baleicum]|uniref:transient receptor potential cation channel protein painless-like n=1 Tax=Lasioglossum baleicum TaxID=434251 RepID=UPI003FCCE96F